MKKRAPSSRVGEPACLASPRSVSACSRARRWSPRLAAVMLRCRCELAASALSPACSATASACRPCSRAATKWPRRNATSARARCAVATACRVPPRSAKASRVTAAFSSRATSPSRTSSRSRMWRSSASSAAAPLPSAPGRRWPVAPRPRRTAPGPTPPAQAGPAGGRRPAGLPTDLVRLRPLTRLPRRLELARSRPGVAEALQQLRHHGRPVGAGKRQGGREKVGGLGVGVHLLGPPTGGDQDVQCASRVGLARRAAVVVGEPLQVGRTERLQGGRHAGVEPAPPHLR
jgi:hypothetical protein